MNVLVGFGGFCQKESLGEYGSGWGWDYNTYAHVFDQTTSEGIPYRLSNNGSSFDILKDFCKEEIELTEGQILHSGHIYTHQTSCRANTQNAGNWYSWPAATAGGSKSSGNELNSICPRGWQLTINAEVEVKSWYFLIRNTYSISDSNDSKIRLLPLSFVRSGYYDQGSLSNRASHGYYWSSTAIDSNNAYALYFRSGHLNPQRSSNKSDGFSVRCVSR